MKRCGFKKEIKRSVEFSTLVLNVVFLISSRTVVYRTQSPGSDRLSIISVRDQTETDT